MYQEAIVKLENDFSLIKPLISFSPYPDENPIGYLIRLAYANRYGSLHWMILSKNGRATYMNYINTYYLIENSAWSREYLNEEVKVISALPTKLLNSSELRFCASCLKEAKYYRISWQLRSSLVCLKHQEFLIEQCPECFNQVDFTIGRVGVCSCGYDLSMSKTKKADLNSLNLQNFVEGIYTKHMIAFHHQDLVDLSLEDRLSFIFKLVRWSIEHVYERLVNGVRMKISKVGLRAVASTFFSTKRQFHYYLSELKEIDNYSPVPDRLSGFILFYRSFFTTFESSAYRIYREWIEEFVLVNWDQSLTHRQSLFSKKTIRGYPWITIENASKQSDIPPSILRRAIIEKRLISTVHHKGKRRYTLVYRPNLSALKKHVNDMFSFTEARNYLGITKKQLYELLENNFIPKVIPPRENYCPTWLIPRESLEDVVYKLYEVSNKQQVFNLSFGDAARIICGRIPDAFLHLLHAILNGEITISYHFSELDLERHKQLHYFAICQASLELWIKSQLDNPNYMTIPELAKQLGINQESAYQLVNFGLIEYDFVDNTRLISRKNQDDFNQKYVLLSHYAKKSNTSSRYLMRQWGEKGIFPVDYSGYRKLRQRIYCRALLERVLNKDKLCDNMF